MTENKRFIKKEYPYDWWFVFDTVQEYTEPQKIQFNDMDNLIPMTEEQVITLLNKLDGMSTKLVDLEIELEGTRDKLEDLAWENHELTEENKELKEILKYTYEIHECETCKYNECFNWLDPATMKREYDSRCGKGLHYGDEVHGCEEYELDLEMFKKRVKR